MSRRASLFALTAAFLALTTPAFSDDWTDLRYYAAGKDTAHVTAMLDRGVDVNLRDADGWTALMIAAEAGDSAMVRLLLARGANPVLANNRGRTAYDVTLSNDVKALLRPGQPTAPASPPAKVTLPAPRAAPPQTSPAKPAADQERRDFCQAQYRAAVAAFCSDDTCKLRENRKWSQCLGTGRYN